MDRLVFYKVKKNYLTYNQGSIVQFNEKEAKELIKKGIIELFKTKKAPAYSKKS